MEDKTIKNQEQTLNDIRDRMWACKIDENDDDYVKLSNQATKMEQNINEREKNENQFKIEMARIELEKERFELEREKLRQDLELQKEKIEIEKKKLEKDSDWKDPKFLIPVLAPLVVGVYQMHYQSWFLSKMFQEVEKYELENTITTTPGKWVVRQLSDLFRRRV